MFYSRAIKHWIILLLSTGAFAAALVVGSYVAPERSSYRIQLSYQSNPLEDTKENVSFVERAKALELTAKSAITAPLGLGWGGFAELAHRHNLELEYPHNLLAELLIEGGWFLAGYTCVLLFFTVRRATGAVLGSQGPEQRWIIGLVFYMLLNSLVSGDLNDNRLLFALLAIASLLEWTPKRHNARRDDRTAVRSPADSARRGRWTDFIHRGVGNQDS